MQIVVALLLTSVLSQNCARINFSSDGVHPDDLVRKGVTTPVWSVDAPNPIIIGSSKKQDYIYVLVESDSGMFTHDDFTLEYDNQKYANSSFVLDKSRKEGTDYYEYAVRIVYHCNNYGGALVNYKLAFTLPGCGSAYVHWKKLCGNPTQPRDGFTMDLEENGKNRTIVKNGLLVNSLEFDKDLDNYFYSVPSDMPKTVFYLHMDSQNPQDQSSQEDPLIAILRDVVMTTPETKISAPRVDADSSVLVPTLNGSMVQFGGIITTNAQRMEVSYDCLDRSYDSYVEVTIPLDYFKDISLFFKKQCKAYSYFNILGVFSAQSIWGFLGRLVLSVLFLVVLAAGVVWLLHLANQKYHDHRLTRAITTLASLKWIKDTRASRHLLSYNQMGPTQPEEMQSHPEDDESKSKDIKTNYGTL